MRKPIFVLIAFFLVAAALIPAYADVTGKAWIETAYSGIDPYYDQSRTIYAYKEETTAFLVVTIQNPNATAPGRIGINVTRVYVTFDWGTTYTSGQVSTVSQVVLQPRQTYAFSLSFEVPNATEVSNLYLHSYTIYADYLMKNASGTNWLSGRWSFPTVVTPDFAVYSADQADAMNLSRIIGTFSPSSGSWNSSKARILANRAINEINSGRAYYAEGDFAHAKQHFSAALDDINGAWSAEEDYLSILEELQIQDIQANINQENAYASFLNGFSTLWVLIGIGWVLLGIGYIVKWLRTSRPEPPAAKA